MQGGWGCGCREQDYRSRLGQNQPTAASHPAGGDDRRPDRPGADARREHGLKWVRQLRAAGIAEGVVERTNTEGIGAAAGSSLLLRVCG